MLAVLQCRCGGLLLVAGYGVLSQGCARGPNPLINSASAERRWQASWGKYERADNRATALEVLGAIATHKEPAKQLSRLPGKYRCVNSRLPLPPSLSPIGFLSGPSGSSVDLVGEAYRLALSPESTLIGRSCCTSMYLGMMHCGSADGHTERQVVIGFSVLILRESHFPNVRKRAGAEQTEGLRTLTGKLLSDV
ncbi:unnamed protein product [Pleuronectes platessa]|uniref:Uncharacterized protein n=1 Tax=Pleuronectes platessa TaxID=8262 RepID=A0A9N7TTI9_PLEPL|nr:unnamed protein product [Pleuronectes platessa]